MTAGEITRMTVELIQKLNYALLTPITVAQIPKKAVEIVKGLTAKQVVYITSNLDDIVSLDIETKGNNAAHKGCEIVGVGLADSKSIFYIDKQTAEPRAWEFLFKKLADPRFKFLGHNLFFDAAFITRDFPQLKLNWSWCTYGMLRQLANEGWIGQTWGLKDAQINLLGWKETNEGDLNSWLVDNTYYMQDLKIRPEGSHQYAVINAKDEVRYARPNKAMMHKAPAEILGYYCGVDAASTYLLFSEVLNKGLEKLPESAQSIFQEYHSIFIDNVKVLIEQQLYGVHIDTDQLRLYYNQLLKDIESAKAEFLATPELQESFNQIREEVIKEQADKEPEKFKKHVLPKEPNKFLKSGEVSGSWTKWKEKVDNDTGPEISKNWIAWEDKLILLKDTYEFNLNSGPALQDLFYNRLKYPVTVKTDSDLPATDSSALRFLGEGGKRLQVYKDLVKEEGYVKTCLEKTFMNTLNLQFRVPGTLTGRLAGSGGLNVQQLPKSQGYLECWKPRPGHVWIQADINSLEQVVLAELSQDPALMSLYGPNAKHNTQELSLVTSKLTEHRIKWTIEGDELVVYEE